MYKALILEDDEEDFKKIRTEIQTKLSGQVEIHPCILGDGTDYESSNYLIGRLCESTEQIPKVLDFYKDVKIFIVDIRLKGDEDTIGLEFIRCLLKSDRSKDYKIYVISKDNEYSAIASILSDETGMEYDRIKRLVWYEQKFGNDHFERALSEKIVEDFNIVPNEEKTDGSVKLSDWWRKFETKTETFLDKGILIVFYILLASTTLYACVYIGLGAWRLIIEKFIYKETADTTVLKFVEHIFLLLLPLSILFGFFNYYKSYLRTHLLNGRLKTLNEEASRNTMTFSKTLFISTTISFIIVKLLERFASSINQIIDYEETEISITRMFFTESFKGTIGMMLLLILLMVFYIRVSHHPKTEKTFKPNARE